MDDYCILSINVVFRTAEVRDFGLKQIFNKKFQKMSEIFVWFEAFDLICCKYSFDYCFGILDSLDALDFQ